MYVCVYVFNLLLFTIGTQSSNIFAGHPTGRPTDDRPDPIGRLDPIRLDRLVVWDGCVVRIEYYVCALCVRVAGRRRTQTVDD